MDLNFIGIGGAFNPKLGNNACYIKEEDKILFIDFGLDCFTKVIKHKLLKDIKEIYVLITHTHGDHIGGLPTFIQYCNALLNIKVKIINNAESFSKNISELLNLEGVNNNVYNFINIKDLPFTFKIELKLTNHSPSLECYSVIFTKDNKKTLYTSDSNDLEFVKEKIKDSEFIKIYVDVGESTSFHIDFNDLKNLDKTKLVLMHIQSEELYKKVKKLKYKTPSFLK